MEMRLNPSARQREILQKTGISTVEELMYADLRKVGWDKADAFYAAFHDIYSSYSLRDQKKLMTHFDSDEHIIARINGKGDKKSVLPLDVIAKETSKEKILSDLLLARSKLKQGSKEWIDITSRIADYAKIKQDEIKTEEQPIRYLLPVRYPTSCKNCLLNQNQNKKK